MPLVQQYGCVYLQVDRQEGDAICTGVFKMDGDAGARDVPVAAIDTVCRAAIRYSLPNVDRFDTVRVSLFATPGANRCQLQLEMQPEIQLDGGYTGRGWRRGTIFHEGAWHWIPMHEPQKALIASCIRNYGAVYLECSLCNP